MWELTGPPFGIDDENLINQIVSAIMENFGHAVEHFVLNYLNLADEFKNPGNFMPPEKINSLSNAERRILKQLDAIYFTGLVINEPHGMGDLYAAQFGCVGFHSLPGGGA